MTSLSELAEKIVASSPIKLTFSSPADRRSTVTKITYKRTGERYFAEWFEGSKAFHKNIDMPQLKDEIVSLLTGAYRNMDAFSVSATHSIRISKKGKPLYTKSLPQPVSVSRSHNREKNYILGDNLPVSLMTDLGMLTPDGHIAAKMQKKYAQINRFLDVIDNHTADDKGDEIRVVDYGCGKSYLTFFVYHYLTSVRGKKVSFTGLDLRTDVIELCTEIAEKHGFTGLNFVVGDIADYTLEEKTDMVISLHACDTATDYALMNAIKNGVKYIFAAPCCQHELAGQIKSEELAILTRYGIIKDKVCAEITNAIRANLLIHSGYSTRIIEFIEESHTPKNDMICARKANISAADRKIALGEVQSITRALDASPTLQQLICPTGEQI